MQYFAVDICLLLLCVVFGGSTFGLEIERALETNFEIKEYIGRQFDTLEERHRMELVELQDRHIKHIEKMEERHKLEMKNIQEVYNAKLEKLETDIVYLKEKMLTGSENRLINGKQEESMVYSEGNVSVTNSPSPSKRLQQLTEQNNTNGSVVSENIENAEQGHENQKTLIKKRQVQSGTRVAFFASLTNTITYLGADQDIAFDNAVSNIGNAYHPNHGTFIAPVAGVYVFTATLMREGDRSWGHFMKNRQILAKFNMPEYGDSATQTIIVELNNNDEVAVQNTYIDRAFAGDRYCTFAGFLLYEHTDDAEIVGR